MAKHPTEKDKAKRHRTADGSRKLTPTEERSNENDATEPRLTIDELRAAEREAFVAVHSDCGGSFELADGEMIATFGPGVAFARAEIDASQLARFAFDRFHDGPSAAVEGGVKKGGVVVNFGDDTPASVAASFFATGLSRFVQYNLQKAFALSIREIEEIAKKAVNPKHRVNHRRIWSEFDSAIAHGRALLHARAGAPSKLPRDQEARTFRDNLVDELCANGTPRHIAESRAKTATITKFGFKSHRTYERAMGRGRN